MPTQSGKLQGAKLPQMSCLFRSFPSRGGTLDLHICEPQRGGLPQPGPAGLARSGQTVPASLVGGRGADKDGLAAIAKPDRCVYYLVSTNTVPLRHERRYEGTVHIS